MSDYNILVDMFKRANISYTAKEDTNTKNKYIIVEAGYISFYSIFDFDKEERLLKVEAYE
jgi:hypothetical protein